LMPSEAVERVREPGLKCRENANGGRRYYWEPTPTAIAAGYKPDKPVRVAGDDKTDVGRRAIAAEAVRLQADMLRFIDERGKPEFDGTLDGLIRRYQRDPESPYQNVKWNTRAAYDGDLKRLSVGVGKRLLPGITRADIDRW
jgi:hypothetical protein